MSEKTAITPHAVDPEQTLPLAARHAKAWLARALANLDGAAIEVVDAEGLAHLGDPAAKAGAWVRVDDPTFYRRILLGGALGAAESYMDGDWSCDDLAGLVRLLLRNEGALWGLESRPSRAAAAIRNAWRLLQPNDRRRARSNARAHYDLGNDLFAEFLDETLAYSCGIFESSETTMGDASVAKFDRLCRMLRLTPEHHLLEIGTGWGGLAIHAARTTGCRVTTTTLSSAQREVALERVARAGVSDRVEVLLEDYRELSGHYDRLVSVEMIEAVGHEFLDTFFQVCANRLRDDGAMALQAITVAEREYDRARRTEDFIKRYIFPGGFLPSIEAMARSITASGSLRWIGVEDITPHYAETLRRWRDRFVQRRDRIRALGYDERFQRMWEFYLCYCEGGFEERRIGCVQLLLGKDGYRGGSLVGAL